MRDIFNYLCMLYVVLIVTGCHNESSRGSTQSDNRIWQEHIIAVVLPMDDGMDKHWERTLEWASQNYERAFSNQKEGIRLKYEFYNEDCDDLAALTKTLGRRTEVVAVIGGMDSDNAAIMAPILTKRNKVFVSLATNSDLIRAYSDTTFWAMTESDITACEILLSKVISYGGKSVALLVDSNDSGTKTYPDWFGFMVKEMDLENGGIFDYTPSSIYTISQQAAAADVDFVICAPSEVNYIRPMLEAFRERTAQNLPIPRLLFTDIGYGVNVLAQHGYICEGIEGITYCADPESGFDVTYNVYFDAMPTLGESQVYDAAMLLGYALWYQHLNPDISLNSALKIVVDGRDLEIDSWLSEGMRDVVDAFARGEHPNISGSCGRLDFDAKVYTNVLCTTYCHYKVYNGKYIILDFNSSEGSYRTDGSRANWNRNKEHMGQININMDKFVYPTLKEKWALLIAGSCGWTNYRFQADVLAMYQLLKSSGYDDDHIVLIMEDDIAHNPSNPFKGVVQVAVGGANLYTDVVIDYHLSDITATDIRPILLGESSERLPEVIRSTENDNIFVFWSGHGYPDELCWAEQKSGLTARYLGDTFAEMDRRNNFRKQIWFVESCYSGSVLQMCEGIPGIVALTAADANETSKADIFNSTLGVWMSNQFTYTLRSKITHNAAINLYNLYQQLFINTLGSHVMIYNEDLYGNVITNTMEEYL